MRQFLLLLSLALLGGTAVAHEAPAPPAPPAPAAPVKPVEDRVVTTKHYDLATPYFATEYTFDHLAFDPGYSERVTKAYYECGHMMYIRKADREKLKRDLAAFFQAAGG